MPAILDLELETPLPDLSHELTRGFAARFIRHKVRQLVRHPGFSLSDAPDLEQEFRVRVLERAALFDPALSHWKSFVTTIVEREFADILAWRGAGKRNGERNVTSLSTLVPDVDREMVELGFTLEEEDGARRRALAVDPPLAQSERTADVHSVIAGLPPELRDLCARLQVRSVSEVAQELGIPRRTLRDRIWQLRERFESAIPGNP